MPEFLLTVNGTERNVALPTLSVQHVVNGPDILEADIQDEDGSIVLEADDVVVLTQTDVSPTTVYFEGLLQSKGNATWTGHGYARLRKITAFDYSIYTTFVDAALSTDGTGSLEDALTSLVTDYLTDYGVTLHPSQDTGPTIAPNAFEAVKAQAILNSLSEQTGWVWKIDADKQLRMWNPATEAADFNVTATNDTYVRDIETNTMRQRSYNRVFVEGGEGYHILSNEQHFGDGASTTFPMNAPMHYFEVDYTASLGFMVGLTLLVTRSGGTTVEYANDQLDAQWTFNRGPEYSLTQVSGAVLGPTEYIVIPGYSAQYPMRLVADGRGSPPDPARDLTLYRPLIFNRDALQAIADETLAATQGDFERINYLTRRTELRPGQTQTVNVPEAGVNGTYTCIDARLRYEQGGGVGEFWMDVTAVNEVTARSFWLNLLDRWLMDTRGGSSQSGSTGSIGSTVIPPVPVTLPAIGSLIGIRRFTSTGAFTYTPTVGTGWIVLELQGAGGGGSGIASPGGGKFSIGRSGGGGGWLRKTLTADFSGATGSVGAKGTGGSSGDNPGNAGGDTTFTTTAPSSATYTAGGGSGGNNGGSALTGFPNISNGVGGGSATGGDDNQPGSGSFAGVVQSATIGNSGGGGYSHYGHGGYGSLIVVDNSTQAAFNATGKGGGGGSAVSSGSGSAQPGGDGSDGLVIIWEYR